MMLSKTYFFLFLFALFLCWLTTAGGSLSEETKSADAIIWDKSVSSVHQAGHAAFLPPPVSHGPISLGQRQLNGRLSKGKFLVASRQIRDPRFKETVIVLIQHDSNGTVGLIINRPTTVRLSDFLPEIKEQPGKGHFTHIGGPVGIAQILLLIHIKNKSEGSQWIFDDVYVSASKTVLEKLIKNPDGETKFRAYAGYAGWIAGQLEKEILRGDWHVVQADAETIFDKSPSDIWPDLIRDIEIIRIEL